MFPVVVERGGNGGPPGKGCSLVDRRRRTGWPL